MNDGGVKTPAVSSGEGAAALTARPSAQRRMSRLSAVPEQLFDRNKRSSGRLGALLAWAVVFADIGTSIYYVPGLLFRELGSKSPSPAAAFVLATGVAFIFLSLKYVNVAARYPDGGGVVSVASDAFGPLVGCIGGILICVDYFLTGALSSVSGFQYLAAELPNLTPWIPAAASVALLVLGALNLIGIRESALVTAALSIASLTMNFVVLGVVLWHMDGARWQLVWQQFSAVRGLPPWTILVGFGSSWLAFSGLESISQIAPALAEPRERTALRAMLLVIACVFLTSPLMTAFETALLDAAAANPDQFVYELGAKFGNRPIQIAIVLTSSTLLVGAANTAMIGCYHVFLALVRLGYMPRWLAERNMRFGTPHRAIIISVLVPVAVVAATRGQMALLGDMYSFGLLGAFTLTSVGIDRMRWQERKRGVGLWIGVFTSLLVVIAWAVNLVSKTKATMFGGTVTLLGFTVAHAVRRGWLGGHREGFTDAEAAEKAASDLASAIEVVTVDEAVDMKAMYPSTTLVAVRAPNLRLFQEALARSRGAGDSAVYIIYVDEIPGLFYPPKAGPSKEALSVLTAAVDYFRQAGVVAVPIWRMAHDTGSSVAGAARKLAVEAVMVGTSQRNAVWHLLRGSVLKSLVRELPHNMRVWICN
ncbi:MAG TPA: universal stress protein [Polyangia bacterium]|nr:universal stress protein [Polyangia bacterium]